MSMLLMHLYNAIAKRTPILWKIAGVIMILKPEKPAKNKSSYYPILLLPFISRLFEKHLLEKLKHSSTSNYRYR